MIAGKWYDPVIGIDIHMIMTPVGAHVPVPHPFVGFVLDPMALIVSAVMDAVGMLFGAQFKGPVLVNGLPAATTGTEVLGIPHIPIGGVFAPEDIPGFDGAIVMGSQTVKFKDEQAARLACMVTTCGFPVNLPTSLLMAIPMGPPVLIGGPPGFSVAALVMQGIRTKWVSDKLKGLFKAKPGSWRSKLICFLTGHPVDVVSGQMLTDAVDLSLPGPIPLEFERTWYSRSVYQGPLGHGWHHRYDQWIEVSPYHVTWRAGDGRDVFFDRIDAGQSTKNREEGATLHRTEAGFVLETRDRLQHHFPLPAGYAPAFDRSGRPLAGRALENGRRLPLARIEDPNGNSIQLHYLDPGNPARLTAITDSAGRRLALEHDARGRITALVGPHAVHGKPIPLVRYRYNDAGDLIEVRDVLDAPFRYLHRGHLIVQEIHRSGMSFYFEYDRYDDPEEARCIRTWGDDGIFTRKLQYYPDVHITVVEDGQGGRTLYFGNRVGLVDRIIDAAGRETKYEWDEDCLKVAETDGNGATRRWEYDADGREVKFIDPVGRERTTIRDARGLPVKLVDPAGATWERGYDARGNVAWAKDPLGACWTYEWDARGRLRRVEDPLANRRAFTYGPDHLVREDIDARGRARRFEYDQQGRLIALEDREGLHWKLERDLKGRLCALHRIDGKTRRWSYDAEDNLVRFVDFNGDETRYDYGGFNWLSRVTRSGRGQVPDEVTRYGWNDEGKLLEVAGEAGAWRFEYDPVGRMMRELTPDGREERYLYDRAENVVRHWGVNAGWAWEYQYDAGGALLEAKGSDGQLEVFTYDDGGRLEKITWHEGTLAWKYDALGRVLEEEQNGETLRYGYDQLGRRAWMNGPRGLLHWYAYDAVGDLTGISVEGEGLEQPLCHQFRYDGEGRELEHIYPNGLHARNSYDARGFWTGQRVVKVQGQFEELQWERRYERDDLGRWVGWEGIEGAAGPTGGASTPAHAEGVKGAGLPASGGAYTRAGAWSRLGTAGAPSSGQRIQLDPLGRLTEVRGFDGRVEEAFHFDPEGNVAVYVREGREQRRVWGPGNRLLQAGDKTYGYDAAGRRTSEESPAGRREYRYDARSQLVEVALENGGTARYGYDPLGRRWYKEVNGARTRFVWDGDELVSGRSSDSEQVYLYVSETCELLSRIEFSFGLAVSSVEHSHLDPVGAVTQWTSDKAGAAHDAHAPGNTEGVVPSFSSQAVEVPELRDFQPGFPGQFFDAETGLYYNRHRYYDPETRCYISPDPLGLLGGEKPYSYVDDPWNWIDPLGLQCRRSQSEKKKFLKQEANSGKNPKWMNQWLRKGKVPPGYHVEHAIPISIGGVDNPSNMRLMLIADHITHHRFYHPWR